MLITSALAPLILLQVSTAACAVPEARFTMTTEPEENVAAEVYLPCEGQDAEDLAGAIIARDGKPVESEMTLDERQVAVLMTGLSKPGGEEKTAVLRRKEQSDEAKPYVCRVHKPAAGDAAVWRAVQWCMTFVVGPTSALTISPPTSTDEQP